MRLSDPRPRQSHSAFHAAVAVAAGEDTNRRRACEAAIFHIPAGLLKYAVTRGGEAGEMGHLAARDEGETGSLGDPEQVFEPRGGDLFRQGGGGRAGVNAGVLIPGGSQPVRGEGGRHGAAHHPGVETAAGVAHNSTGGIGYQIRDYLTRLDGAVCQGTRHARAQIRKRRSRRDWGGIEVLDVRERMPERVFEGTPKHRS